jgi:hypothetical protein
LSTPKLSVFTDHSLLAVSKLKSLVYTRQKDNEKMSEQSEIADLAGVCLLDIVG